MKRFILLAFLSGCSNYNSFHSVSRDGSIVGIKVEDDFTLSNIDDGCRYWDEVGVNFRVNQEPYALTIKYGKTQLSHVNYESGFYDGGGIITIDTLNIDSVIVAHELGHTLGLKHILGNNVMNHDVPDVETLQAGDVEEFIETE